MPVHPDFEVISRVPTAAESDVGEVEPWCELLLTINQEDEEVADIELTRAAGEAILEAVNEALHPWSGVTIREQIWLALDDATETLMSGKGDAHCKGQAYGLALALATFLNPYAPNVDAVREEAVSRWESVEAPQDSEDVATSSVEQEGDSDDMPFG